MVSTPNPHTLRQNLLGRALRTPSPGARSGKRRGLLLYIVPGASKVRLTDEVQRTTEEQSYAWRPLTKRKRSLALTRPPLSVAISLVCWAQRCLCLTRAIASQKYSLTTSLSLILH
jgi:hypothetical protein